MPRLSVIVPHISTEAALEQTLLSLLEHKDHQCEVIVVHAGNYADPYQLGDDEVVLVNSDAKTAAELLNEGIQSAVAPVLQFILPGTEANDLWYRDVLSAFEDYQIGAVAAGIASSHLKATVVGIRASQLPRHQLVRNCDLGETAYPLLNGGYFRRKLLNALDGLMIDDSLVAAETELAIAIQSLGVCVPRYEEATVECRELIPDVLDHGYSEGQHLGRIARAYSMLPESLVAIDSLPVRMGKLAASLLSPASISHRLGWTLGLQDASLVRPVRERFHRARDAWNEYLHQAELQSQSSYRRAA